MSTTKLSEDPRFGKLPAWVRSGVEDLERTTRRAELHAAKASLSNAPEGSNTVIDAHNRNPIWLPNHERVRFVVGDSNYRQYIEVHVCEEGWHKGTIELMGGDSLLVYPQASNVVRVGVQA